MIRLTAEFFNKRGLLDKNGYVKPRESNTKPLTQEDLDRLLVSMERGKVGETIEAIAMADALQNPFLFALLNAT